MKPIRDAGPKPIRDAGEPLGFGADASLEAGIAEGPGDPKSKLGAAGQVEPGEVLVQLLVNASEIRKHPVGSRLGPILVKVPQWRDFLDGSGIDPVRDTDWLFIQGPSFYNTARDAILIHYSSDDAIVDQAVDRLASRSSTGGPFDAGIPGVKASIGFADRAERVFLRPQSKLLAIVPADYAAKAAKMLRRAKIQPKAQP